MVEESLSTFGARMRQAREARGWSPSDLARQSEVDLAWITRLESGERHNVSLRTARKIARALRIGLDYLAGTFDPDVCPAGIGTAW